MNRISASLISLALCIPAHSAHGASPSLGWFDVTQRWGGAGARGDCSTDDGPAIQRAIDAATKTAIPSRAGTVFLPPTARCYLVRTALTVTLTIASNLSQNTFRMVGSGADGPIKVDLDASTDFLTHVQQGEWQHASYENLAFMTSDDTNSTADCRDLFYVQAASGPSQVYFRSIHDLATYATRAKVHAADGKVYVQDWTDAGGIGYSGAATTYVVYCDQCTALDVNGLYIFWQGAYRGVSYSNGTYAAAVEVKPMATADYNGNHDGTQIAIRNLTIFPRTAAAIEVVGDATHIARTVILRDSFLGTGGNDVIYLDNTRKFTVLDTHIANSAQSTIEVGAGVLEHLYVRNVDHSAGNALRFRTDVSITGAIDFDEVTLDGGVALASGFSPTTGPVTMPVFSRTTGVISRYVNAGAAVATQLLVKPNGSGSFVRLADGDSGALATGVALSAASGANVIFPVTEQRGQVVTVAADGAITEGVQVYNSATSTKGGQVSASVSGTSVGLAVGAASGGVVLVLLR